MNNVFVIKNQLGLYLNRQQEWVDGSDRYCLFRAAHKDEAINTVFEVSSRDIYLRAETLACEIDDKGNPIVTAVAALAVAPIAEADSA
ncbi:MAG TPA: hypothetical protein VGK97_07830 [Spongiibacteraceae bacterium]|jgi:hypothetical protein